MVLNWRHSLVLAAGATITVAVGYILYATENMSWVVPAVPFLTKALTATGYCLAAFVAYVVAVCVITFLWRIVTKTFKWFEEIANQPSPSFLLGGPPSESQRRRLRLHAAWHEAGHVVMAHKWGVRVRRGWIDDDGSGQVELESDSRLREKSPATYAMVQAEIAASGMAGVRSYLEETNPENVSRWRRRWIVGLDHGIQEGAGEDIRTIESLRSGVSDPRLKEAVGRDPYVSPNDYRKIKAISAAIVEGGSLTEDEIQNILQREISFEQFVLRVSRWVNLVPRSIWITAFAMLAVPCTIAPFLVFVEQEYFSMSLAAGLGLVGSLAWVLYGAFILLSASMLYPSSEFQQDCWLSKTIIGWGLIVLLVSLTT